MDGIDRHKPLTLILPRYKGIQSRMGTETVQEVNKAEIYTFISLGLNPRGERTTSACPRASLRGRSLC